MRKKAPSHRRRDGVRSSPTRRVGGRKAPLSFPALRWGRCGVPPFADHRADKRTEGAGCRATVDERRGVRGRRVRPRASDPRMDPVFTADYRWSTTLRVAHTADDWRRARVPRSVRLAACLLPRHRVLLCGGQRTDDHGRMAPGSAGPRSRPRVGTASAAAIAHAIASHVDGNQRMGSAHAARHVVSDADNVGPLQRLIASSPEA